jgi:hypothetical protein
MPKTKKIKDSSTMPCYEVWILAQSGPDSVDWDCRDEHEDLFQAMQIAEAYYKQGYSVNIFDPYMGKSYDYPEDY